MKIGQGFTAKSFQERDYQGSMDPLLMVDHYTMTKPTFGMHPHAGMSAVSIVFEDSKGKFHNRDSLGKDFDIMPGDLYWLKAGSGVYHDEKPRENSKTHGLQVFVNLPADQRRSKPNSLHVKAKDVPIITENRARIRVLIGEVNGVKAKPSPALPMTILEGKMNPQGTFSSLLKAGNNAWLYVMEGKITLNILDEEITISAGESLAIQNYSKDTKHTIELSNSTNKQAKFMWFEGKPVSS